MCLKAGRPVQSHMLDRCDFVGLWGVSGGGEEVGCSLLTHDMLKKSLTHDLRTPDTTEVEPFPFRTTHMVSLSNIMDEA